MGIDYRFNKNVGLRVENHFNRGYVMPRLTGGGEQPTFTEDKASKEKWNMLATSVYFMF